MSNKLERALFKAVTVALLEYEPTESELRELAKSVTSGRLSAALGNVVSAYADVSDLAAPSPQSVPSDSSAPQKKTTAKEVAVGRKKSAGKPSKDSSANEVFDLAKRRKITRQALQRIFDQVDTDAARSLSDEASMREWLEAFHSRTSAEDWSLLQQIIAGNISSDPYLRDIIGR